MIGGKGAGSELWLKAFCLATSIGLHFGLVAVDWPKAGTSAPNPGPIMISLAAGPAGIEPQRAGTDAPATPARRVRNNLKELPQRAVLPPTPNVVATVQPETMPADLPQCALPETAVTEGVFDKAVPGAVTAAVGEGENAYEGKAGEQADVPVAGIGSRGGGLPGPSAGPLILARPRYASNPKPEYPRLARQNHWEGVVRLRASITATGEVESVVVENSSGHQVLDSSAVGGVRNWRFVPARRGDLPVPCEVRIPIAFKLGP